MANRFPLALTFDDVLIRPGSSTIEPSEASVKTEAVRGFFLSTPIISAAMDRVTEEEMAIALSKFGGLGTLHRNCPPEHEVAMVKRVKEAKARVAAACGPFDLPRAKALEAAGADVIMVDCAHGHNQNVIKAARKIRHALRKAKLVVGNIATKEAARDLVPFVDGIKVGVGPGSICTTRIISGVGMPQLAAIFEVVGIASRKKVPVIADGGIRTSGDVAKALAAGASAVMLGNLLAGTAQAPGRIILKNGMKYKEYRGMGSRAALQSRFSKDRYLVKGKQIVEEGVEALIHYKGPLEPIIHQLVGGLKVSMGYIGARTIAEMSKRAKFVYITKAAVRESQPHNLDIVIHSHT